MEKIIYMAKNPYHPFKQARQRRLYDNQEVLKWKKVFRLQPSAIICESPQRCISLTPGTKYNGWQETDWDHKGPLCDIQHDEFSAIKMLINLYRNNSKTFTILF